MEIYENTALMWLQRTRRAELVDLEVEEEKNLEVEENLVVEEENNLEENSLEEENLEMKKHTSNETMVLSLEVQCAIGKVRVMLNEAKEDLEVAVRRGNFAEARTFQQQVR